MSLNKQGFLYIFSIITLFLVIVPVNAAPATYTIDSQSCGACSSKSLQMDSNTSQCTGSKICAAGVAFQNNIQPLGVKLQNMQFIFNSDGTWSAIFQAVLYAGDTNSIGTAKPTGSILASSGTLALTQANAGSVNTFSFTGTQQVILSLNTVYIAVLQISSNSTVLNSSNRPYFAETNPQTATHGYSFDQAGVWGGGASATAYFVVQGVDPSISNQLTNAGYFGAAMSFLVLVGVLWFGQGELKMRIGLAVTFAIVIFLVVIGATWING